MTNDLSNLVQVRDEQPADIQAIYDLTKIAFAPMPYSGGDEQDLINALRADGALMVSLVALLDGAIVGHIAFSRVQINEQDGHWFDLGPVSVAPALQSRGIGSVLIQTGLVRIKAMDAHGCVLLGYPSYYSRFGFTHDPGLTYLNRANPNFQCITFKGSTPRGNVTYHPAFG